MIDSKEHFELAVKYLESARAQPSKRHDLQQLDLQYSIAHSLVALNEMMAQPQTVINCDTSVDMESTAERIARIIRRSRPLK